MNNLTKEQIEKMSDAQVYAALTQDFLERDGDTFVRIRRTERLGWEETLPKGTAYSERMLSPGSTEELLKSAYSHACDMIRAMNTPYKVQVNVSGKTSFTDTNVLYVASDVLTDNSLSVGQRLDAFTGYAVHEGSHLLYTDFQETRRNPAKNEIIRFLRNVLEDEMIEIRLGEEKPGLANFLQVSKYHAFDRYTHEIKKNPDAQKVELTDIVNAVLSMVRYPKLLTPDVVQTYGRLLLQIREVIKSYPADTKAVNEAADKIYDIILSEYEQQLKQEEKEKQQQQPQDGASHEPKENQSQENTGQSTEQNDGNPSGSKQGKGASQRKNSKNGSDKKESAVESSKSQDPSQKSDSEIKKEAHEKLEEEFDSIKKELENLASELKKGLNTDEIAKEFQKDDSELALECEGKIERGKNPNVIVTKQRDNKTSYDLALSRIRRYIPAVSKILRSNGTEYQTSLRGMRSGKMDPCKIAEAFQGVPSVYMRETQVKADKMSVALLIDESGSMYGEKMQAAKDTAVLFNEALRTVPNISLYIYGYTNGRNGKTLLFKYAEPGYSSKYSLGCIDSRWGTPTAEAINETVNRLSKSQDEQKLLIVVSDGEPDGPESEVTEQVKNAEKRSIKVLGISIDDGLPESSLKKMYGNYIKFTDMSRLVSDLSIILKKEVLNKTKKKYCD